MVKQNKTPFAGYLLVDCAELSAGIGNKGGHIYCVCATTYTGIVAPKHACKVCY